MVPFVTLRLHAWLTGPFSESLFLCLYAQASSLLPPHHIQGIKSYVVSLIHLELSFVKTEKWRSSFILLYVIIQFDQQPSLKMLSFPQYVLFFSHTHVQKSVGYKECCFLWEFPVLFHWSVCLLLCQYHSVFITVVLQYNLKSGMISKHSQQCFYYPGLFLVILGLLCKHGDIYSFDLYHYLH